MKSVFRVLPVALAASAAALLSVSSAFASNAGSTVGCIQLNCGGGTQLAVPEPISVTLIGVGIAGLVGKKWMDRRRGK